MPRRNFPALDFSVPDFPVPDFADNVELGAVMRFPLYDRPAKLAAYSGKMRVVRTIAGQGGPR
jgi:hypothetical protein